MRRADEVVFFNEMMRRALDPDLFAYARELAEELEINANRAQFLCEKWVDKGWADCGISPLACFFTPQAPEWISSDDTGPPIGRWPANTRASSGAAIGTLF